MGTFRLGRIYSNRVLGKWGVGWGSSNLSRCFSTGLFNGRAEWKEAPWDSYSWSVGSCCLISRHTEGAESKGNHGTIQIVRGWTLILEYICQICGRWEALLRRVPVINSRGNDGASCISQRHCEWDRNWNYFMLRVCQNCGLSRGGVRLHGFSWST